MEAPCTIHLGGLLGATLWSDGDMVWCLGQETCGGILLEGWNCLGTVYIGSSPWRDILSGTQLSCYECWSLQTQSSTNHSKYVPHHFSFSSHSPRPTMQSVKRPFLCAAQVISLFTNTGCHLTRCQDPHVRQRLSSSACLIPTWSALYTYSICVHHLLVQPYPESLLCDGSLLVWQVALQSTSRPRLPGV